jgi:hypothetical protein
MNGKHTTSLSFNWAYLISQQRFFISRFQMSWERKMFLDTITRNPDNSGFYNRKEIIPTADRFFSLVSFGQ